MSEFKGTKGNLELKFISGICIGIGTVGNFSQMTANSVINHINNDSDYRLEKEEIEANMLLYSKAPEMLEMLIFLRPTFKGTKTGESIEQLIKEATEL